MRTRLKSCPSFASMNDRGSASSGRPRDASASSTPAPTRRPAWQAQEPPPPPVFPPDRARVRLARDIVPTLRHYPDWQFELIVVDNSAERMDDLDRDLAALPWPARYLWQQGANTFYGPALNRAAALAQHPVIVYTCT